MVSHARSGVIRRTTRSIRDWTIAISIFLTILAVIGAIAFGLIWFGVYAYHRYNKAPTAQQICMDRHDYHGDLDRLSMQQQDIVISCVVGLANN